MVTLIDNSPQPRTQSRIVDACGRPAIPPEWKHSTKSGPAAPFEKPSELHTTLSEFVEFAFQIPDKRIRKIIPFRFDQRRYLRQIYDSQARKILLLFSRQTEKSTLLGNSLLSYCCLRSNLSGLYVAPTNTQAKTFVRDRLNSPVRISKALRAWVNPSEFFDTTSLKLFNNLSQIEVRYAFLSADRARGVSADFLIIDELQDIYAENVPVIEECLSHNPASMQLSRYAGTPKTSDNTIQIYWEEHSARHEWVVPCARHRFMTPAGYCRTYYNILGEANIGPQGLICDRCQQPIFAADPGARWALMNREAYLDSPDPTAVFEGYRVCRLMVPWVEWADLLYKQEHFPRYQFQNEILTIASDEGSKPLVENDIKANCNPNLSLHREYLEQLRMKCGGTYQIFAGVDWMGGSQKNSFTVVTLGSYLGGEEFSLFYFRRFDAGVEGDPEYQLQFIIELFRKWNPVIIAADFGGGLHPNDRLEREFGCAKVVKFQYSRIKKLVEWDGDVGRFQVNRTGVMAAVINAIKRKNVFQYPNWEEFRTPYASDFISLVAQFNERSLLDEYTKTPGTTDDCFHAGLLCFLGSMIIHPRPDVLYPQTPKP